MYFFDSSSCETGSDKNSGIVIPAIPSHPHDPIVPTEQDVMNTWDINKRNKCVHETVELYWEDLKKNGFKISFCGHEISIPLKSDNLPQIKWVDIADAEGDYNAETHTICLKKSLLHTPQDLYKTVIHELTHAAQNEIVKQITDYTPNQAEYHLLKLLDE